MAIRALFDLDGVFANFSWPFAQLLAAQTGRTIGEAVPDESLWPPHWDFFYPFYTAAEVRAAFETFTSAPAHWYHLKPCEGAAAALERLADLERANLVELYFATARAAGPGVKRESERWLQRYGLPHPTVATAIANKGALAAALRADVAADDRAECLAGIHAESPGTATYLIARPYNAADRRGITGAGGTVVSGILDVVEDLERRCGGHSAPRRTLV